jgi:hypothetical protein
VPCSVSGTIRLWAQLIILLLVRDAELQVFSFGSGVNSQLLWLSFLAWGVFNAGLFTASYFRTFLSVSYSSPPMILLSFVIERPSYVYTSRMFTLEGTSTESISRASVLRNNLQPTQTTFKTKQTIENLSFKDSRIQSTLHCNITA